MASVEFKATRISPFSLKTPQMRTFHLTWFAFFLAFFGWFGIAPLMAIVRDDLGLTKTQVGNTIIASVAITVVARLAIGWLCDRIGPRLAYSGLLVIGSIPVMSIGLAQSYETFLLFRLAIGVIGASFVITQYHTSVMFAPNVIGTANATTAGWGNLGGGVTQMAMPLALAGVLMFGVGETVGWRVAMVTPGIALLLVGVAYYFFTQDCPEGNYPQLRAEGRMPPASAASGTFLEAIADYRVWALFIIYGACFGVELTINNIAALYFHDRFELSVATAGVIAGLFGLMNIFARTMGGMLGDKAGIRAGLKGRVFFLGVVLLLEGFALLLFSQMASLVLAVGAMIVFSLFVQMSRGSHLFRGAVHKPQGPWVRSRNRGSRRQRRSGVLRVPVQDGVPGDPGCADDSGAGRYRGLCAGVSGKVLPRAGVGGASGDTERTGVPAYGWRHR